ncbi:winged helix-turn-helix transcriptional regulator [Acetobacterium malicum]|uniref:Winged helix-turn-helix transcriptional regulator n=1 Tax=Acetobacterium malicum TaxID=52692 RepID=A0ABR6Z1S2_9FIRM|nr:sugar-binding transcriptional regulator [Acetobacterium malicum]MBC3901087.1 winged helix-turn-helix transcriptional regulator [Acetobacterium malicum]
MKKVVDDERLMVKICEMYYNQDISQKLIATELGLSRPTVSRILQNARERGIVKIIIDPIFGNNYVDLEKKLENRYGLKEVFIVDMKQDNRDQKDELAKATANYLERLIKDDTIIGVSMGSSIGQIYRFVSKGTSKRVTFIPLIGGIGHLGMELHSNTIVEALAKSFGGVSYLLHAPARVSGVKIKEELMKEPDIRRIIKMGDGLDVAVVGIGVPNRGSAIMATGYYDEKDMEIMRQKNVVGDVCMQFFDINGSTEAFEADNCVIGVDIKKLRRIPHSIGVASGPEKAQAIQGAIKGGFINVLVTDVECGKRLLELDEAAEPATRNRTMEAETEEIDRK